MQFAARMTVPLLMIGVVLFLGVGVVVNSSSWTGVSGLTSVPPVKDAAMSHFVGTAQKITQLPKSCVYGEIASDFHQKQCNRYWVELFAACSLALAPCLVFVGLIVLGYGRFRKFYAQMVTLTEDSKPNFFGVVTDPSRAETDLFSWFYCLRPVTIELGDGSQTRVHLNHTQTPKPGEELQGFNIGNYFGQKRQICLISKDAVQIR